MLPIHVNRPLKTVTDRIRSCRAVLWALDAFGDRLLDVLGGEFTPLLDEGQVMPFPAQLELFRKKLTLGRDQMVASDRAYRDQRARESIFRGRCGCGSASAPACGDTTPWPGLETSVAPAGRLRGRVEGWQGVRRDGK